MSTASVPARTVICGVGLIGGSFAAAAKRSAALGHVVGVGRSSANLDVARDRGLVDETATDAAAAMRDADLVVLAVPVETGLDLLAVAAGVVPPDCVVTDVCSVKQPMCERAAALGLGARFVGAHPIAGSERAGAAAADPDLFVDRVTVITRTSATEADTVERVADLWRSIGSHVVELEAAAHDRVMAMTSHLPQMVAFALGATIDAAPDPELARVLSGAGLRDTTRLAASDPAMWTSIARSNAAHILEAMDVFGAVWSELRAAVAAGDVGAMVCVMEAARRARETLES